MSEPADDGPRASVPRPPRSPLVFESAAVKAARNRHNLGLVVLPHLGAAAAVGLAVVYGVSPAALWATALMYAVSMLGIMAGYHRLFAHRRYTVERPGVRAMLGIMGSTSGQGPLVYWVALHRLHHARSDQPGDPHSPLYREGSGAGAWLMALFRSHLGWMFWHPAPNTARLAPDLIRDPVASRISKTYARWVGLGIALPGIGVWIATGHAYGLLEGVLWGGFVRLCLCNHAIWSVNSFCHLLGARRFTTTDDSRNNRLLAIPTFGEAWHNNHHAHAAAAVHGLAWYQVDLAGLFILGLARLGLATKLVVHRGAAPGERTMEPSS